VATVNRYGQRTVEFFEEVRAELSAELRTRKCDFTIQTQSIVDGSQPGIPHFIYTDHTHLANLYYQDSMHADCTHANGSRKNAAFIDMRRPSSPQRVRLEITGRALRDFRVADPVRGIGWQYPDTPARISGRGSLRQQGNTFCRNRVGTKGRSATPSSLQRGLKGLPDAKLKIIGCSPDVDLPNCTILGRLPLKEVAKHLPQQPFSACPLAMNRLAWCFLKPSPIALPVIGSPVARCRNSSIENRRQRFLVPLGRCCPSGGATQRTDLHRRRNANALARPVTCAWAVVTRGNAWEPKSQKRIRRELQSAKEPNSQTA